MEITQEQIIEAITTNPELVTGILPSIQETEAVQNIIQSKADAIYQTKFNDEVKSLHAKYDNDMLEILGEKPGTKDDGNKEKSYEKARNLFSELKDLRGQKESLSKDAKVQELEDKIATLTAEGGGKHVQQMFDAAKQSWETEKQSFMDKISTMETDNETFKKKTIISSAFKDLKLNPDTDKTLSDIAIEKAEKELLNNSKFENGKLVFLDAEGKPVLNPTTHELKDASQMLQSMEVIKAISLKEDEKKGGNANRTVKGSIITTSVEGKDTKKLNLAEGSFSTKVRFIQAAEKALLDSGITKRDKEWDSLKTQAYKDYNVSAIPAE